MNAIKYVTDVKINDVEKRRYPTKYYTYVTEVTWNDGNKETIARRYSQFFDLHCTIVDEFPIESGIKSAKKRIIPFLPGKVFILTESRARKRVEPINEYCKKLIELPAFIARCETIVNFFEQNAEDKLPSQLNKDSSSVKDTANEISGPVELEQYIVIADFEKDSRKEISLKAGEVVGLLEKSNTGWWMVTNENKNNGWAPAAYLESLSEEKIENNNNATKRLSVGKGAWYVAVHTVREIESSEELAFTVGEKLEVLEQNLDGWWYAVSKTGKQGWVPGSYLEKLHSGKNASAEETTRLSKRKVFKRAAPKRGTVRKTIQQEDRVRAKQMIREKLRRKLSNEKELLDEYETTNDFDQDIEGGIKFKSNQTVQDLIQVLEKSNSGWWYCRIGDIKGWISEEYLKPKTDSGCHYSIIDDKSKPSLPPRPNVPNSPQKALPPSITRSALPPIPGTTTKQNLINVPSKMIQTNLGTPPRPPVSSNSTNQLPSTPKQNARPPPVPRQNFALPPVPNQNFQPRSILKSAEGNGRNDSNPLQINTESYKNVKTTNNNNEYSSNLSDYKWFKDISRQRAESILQTESKEGFFIMRKSKDFYSSQPYSITLYHDSKIWNLHIRRRGDNTWAVGSQQIGENTFSSLPELVEFYSTHYLAIGQENVLLSGSPLRE